MDALIFGFYIGSMALAVAYLAYTVYDYFRWKARSRCPCCGRWRYELSYPYVYDECIFECRKCRMTWIAGPGE